MESTVRPAVASAIARFNLARHALVEVIQRDHPGQVVTSRGRAFFVVVGRGGSPTLHTARAVSIRKPKSTPAPSPASE